MTVSARIQEKVVDCLSDFEHHSVQEIKSFLQQCGMSDYTEGQFSGSINTLLRNKTIRKIGRGVYALQKRSEDMRKCFIVSPIGTEGSTIREEADKLFRHIIKPVCEQCEFEAVRVDQMNDANSITQTIIEQLDTADLVIADMTGHNPNVFYEMGYRYRTKKPMIHLRKKGETLPFDVTTIRTLEYDLTDLDNVEAVKMRLEQTIGSFSFEEEELDTPDEQVTENRSMSAILTMLYQIQDSINELKDSVERKDKEMIQTIVETSMNSAPKEESTDAIMMKVLLPELIKNPKGFSNLMKLAEMAEKK